MRAIMSKVNSKYSFPYELWCPHCVSARKSVMKGHTQIRVEPVSVDTSPFPKQFDTRTVVKTHTTASGTIQSSLGNHQGYISDIREAEEKKPAIALIRGHGRPLDSIKAVTDFKTQLILYYFISNIGLIQESDYVWPC